MRCAAWSLKRLYDLRGQWVIVGASKRGYHADCIFSKSVDAYRASMGVVGIDQAAFSFSPESWVAMTPAPLPILVKRVPFLADIRDGVPDRSICVTVDPMLKTRVTVALISPRRGQSKIEMSPPAQSCCSTNMDMNNDLATHGCSGYLRFLDVHMEEIAITPAWLSPNLYGQSRTLPDLRLTMPRLIAIQVPEGIVLTSRGERALSTGGSSRSISSLPRRKDPGKGELFLTELLWRPARQLPPKARPPDNAFIAARTSGVCQDRHQRS